MFVRATSRSRDTTAPVVSPGLGRRTRRRRGDAGGLLDRRPLQGSRRCSRRRREVEELEADAVTGRRPAAGRQVATGSSTSLVRPPTTIRNGSTASGEIATGDSIIIPNGLTSMMRAPTTDTGFGGRRHGDPLGAAALHHARSRSTRKP